MPRAIPSCSASAESVSNSACGIGARSAGRSQLSFNDSFQASSDHGSTHLSYAFVLAEDNSRDTPDVSCSETERNAVGG